jgi:hypothetical protein
MARNPSHQKSIQPVFIEGGVLMNLKAKMGGNQKGLCFVSREETDFEIGVYEISCGQTKILADIRMSPQVPIGLAVLDSRLYSWLGCEDADEITLVKSSLDIPLCKQLELSVSSTKNLDNKLIAEAISKRVNDLQDDFDGLILEKNQRIIIEHLGIQFTIRSHNSINGSCRYCRVAWSALEKILLTPVVETPAYNLIFVIELGAAAHIDDVLQTTTDGSSIFVPRYQVALEILEQIMFAYSGYGTGSQFSGIIYSDDVVPYSVFDSQTGTPVQISKLYSKSLLQSFSEWVSREITVRKNKPSNPGGALASALEIGYSLPESNEHPTLILLCSSGIHSHGPDPVKVVKKAHGSHNIPIICVSTGNGSNKDVLQAIAEITNGMMIEITSIRSVAEINDIIANLFTIRS